jgi:hypothetical protein
MASSRKPWAGDFCYLCFARVSSRGAEPGGASRGGAAEASGVSRTPGGVGCGHEGAYHEACRQGARVPCGFCRDEISALGVLGKLSPSVGPPGIHP